MGEVQSNDFTCDICCETVLSSKRFINQTPCLHSFYCVDCIDKYIQVKIHEYNMSDIRCPCLSCLELLHPLSCRVFLQPKVFERWCAVLCESSLLNCETTYCPSRCCSELILNECEDKNTTETKCPMCNCLFCFKCRGPSHKGYRCGSSYTPTDNNNTLFYRLVKKRNWQRCPSCMQCVERTAGCNIIHCRCGQDFCYACGKKETWRHDGCVFDAEYAEWMRAMPLITLGTIGVFLTIVHFTVPD